MFWRKKSRGIITLTYEGIQNRCLEKICRFGFKIESVEDFPDLELLQFTGTHKKIRNKEPFMFYRVRIEMTEYVDEYNYKGNVIFTEYGNFVHDARWVGSKPVHELINMDLQGV